MFNTFPRGPENTSSHIEYISRRHSLAKVLRHSPPSTTYVSQDQSGFKASFWAHYWHLKKFISKRSPTSFSRALTTSILPNLARFAPLWTATQTWLATLDALQRHITCKTLTLRPHPQETLKGYHTRANKAAADHIAMNAGPWSEFVVRQQVTWRDHLQRHPQHAATHAIPNTQRSNA